MELNLRRYAYFYGAIMLGVIAVDLALAQWTSTDLPAGMSVWLPAITAAQDLGMRHGRDTEAALPKGAAWRLAWPLTLVATLIQLVFAGASIGVMTVLGFDVFSVLSVISPPVWMMIFVGMVVLVYLTNRIFLGMGVRNGIKVAAKLRAKS
ncbi:ABZJ_00895 family protein [uncultured Shimia sp.]|uniref:ABZJ_00895 family protein n=1 Tax=uncultured Shimia sp. TaxID=573152 RepID=UPI0025E9EDA8|nr:ABZJ_00895 family protein [uncultured Shimia sp.]